MQPTQQAFPEAGGLRAAVRFPLRGADGDFWLDMHLAIPQGKCLAITGPSGAGKTSLLRCIAGLAMPVEGRVTMGDELWCDTSQGYVRPVRQRSIGFVFQDYALFPNMTARGNVEFALHHAPRAERRAQATDLLALAGLSSLEHRLPASLSGGQRQRLALIRALARHPRLLMLDEPLSALDPGTRVRMQEELLALHSVFDVTLLLVSHDPAEVQRLADTVIHIDRGQRAQP